MNRKNKKIKEALDKVGSITAVLILLSVMMASIPTVIAVLTPTIEITYMPPYGDPGYMSGFVRNIIPADYKVACYTYVSGWWTKPYFDSPLTTINPDGSWSCNIVTGGSDAYSTKERVYVIPNGYNPPQMSGQEIFPADLDANKVAQKESPRKLERVINFSGRDWIVKASVIPTGPGLNYFNDSNDSVWVDAQIQLHLKIIKVGNTWYSSEVILKDSPGYGEYIFYLATRPDQIDKNAVWGLFTWDTFAPQFNYREIDIELSRWGLDTNDNSQFVVQPWNRAANMHRFNSVYTGNNSVYLFNWTASKISFKGLRGWNASSQDPSDLINAWDYTGADIPPPGGENARINLWLFDPNNVLGIPPSDGKEVEVIIKEFKFVPPGSQIVLTPKIYVAKTASPTTLLVGGGNVTYNYTVINNGDVALSNITLADDKCVSIVYTSGDTNLNSQLDTMETWNYTCNANINATTTNKATATGNYSGTLVSATDAATVTVATPTPTPTPYTGGSSGNSGYSSGSSGGGVTSCEIYKNIKKSFSVDGDVSTKVNPMVYKFKDLEIVKEAGFTPTYSEGLVSAKSEDLQGRSACVSVDAPSSTEKIAYFNVWAGTGNYSSSYKVKDSFILFGMPKNFTDSDIINVKLLSFNNGSWTESKYEKISEGVYKAYVPKFGNFALAEIFDLKIDPITPEEAEKIKSMQKTDIPEKVATPAPTKPADTPKQTPDFFFTGAILAIAGASALYRIRKK